jgi:hypothetical protein
MRDAAGSRGLVWFISESGELEVCVVNAERVGQSQTHVQRANLKGDNSSIPVGVEVIGRTVAVAKANLDKCADEISFFDQFTLTETGSFRISSKDQLTCMTEFGDGLVLGSGFYGEQAFSLGSEPLEGRVIVLNRDEAGMWTERCSSVVLRNDGEPAGPVFALTASGDFIVALAIRTVAILRVSDRNDLVHVCSIESDFLGISVAARQTETGLTILVGDVNRSCSLFNYDRDENTLVRTAKDLVPAGCLSVDFLGDVMVMGDELGNVYGLKLVEPTLGRLERLEGCNIGRSAITRIRRIDDSSCWVGCRDGSISLLSLGQPATGRKLTMNKSVLISDVYEPTRVSYPSVSHRIPLCD